MAGSAGDRVASDPAWPDRLSGLGRRGFLGTTPAASPAAITEAARLGILQWNVKIFVVASLEEAIETDYLISRVPDILRDPKPGTGDEVDWSALSGLELVRASRARLELLRSQNREIIFNPAMTGLYIVAPGVNLKEFSDAQATEFAASIPDRAIFEIDDEGKAVRLSADLVASRFEPLAIKRTQYFKFEPAHFRQDGWFFPKSRGVLLLEEMNAKESRTFKKLNFYARTQARQVGLEVRTNERMEEVLTRTKDQQRIGQAPQNNRVTEEKIANFLNLQREGVAYSFESWQNARLTGGTYGTFKDGRMSLDSVFYDQIDDAKFPFLMLRDRLLAADIRFIDLQMVTPFTRSLKGRYISGEDFIRLLDGVNPDAQPDLRSAWTPLDGN